MNATAGKSTAKVQSQKKPAPPPEWVPLDRIDDRQTLEVRECRNEEAIRDYMDTEGEWETNPENGHVQLHTAGGVCYASDGGHRIAAKRRLGRDKVFAVVHRYDTEQEAKDACLLAAVSANATHGLRRSSADKDWTLHNALSMPENAECSDREIAEMCRLSRSLVNRKRRQMTHANQLQGAARADAPHRPPLKDVVYRNGWMLLASGETVREEDYLLGKVMVDAKGQPIPGRLAEAFAAAPWVVCLCQAAGAAPTGPACEVCHGRNFLSRRDYARQPKSVREAIVVAVNRLDAVEPEVGE